MHDDKETGPAKRILLRVVPFSALLGIMLVALTTLLTPYDLGTHTKESVRGIYEQPANTVQVAYMGASNALSSFSPMAIYDEFGINGYNCSTSVQPTLMSYYLLKDLMRNQAGSLRLVVMDPSLLLSDDPESFKASWAERVLLQMQPSMVKIQAILDYCNVYDQNIFETVFTLAKFHSRWDELTESDFDLINSVSDSIYSHGEFIRYSANLENPANANITSPSNAAITGTADHSDAALESRWHEQSVRHLDTFVEYCHENDIDILFVKTPKISWDDFQHDSLQHLADRYGIPFIDLSTSEMMKQLDLTYSADFVDDKHANIHGSEKISHYLGSYILDRYPHITPLPENKRLAHDLEIYQQCREDGKLLLCHDFIEYLELAKQPRYRIFIATQCCDMSSASADVVGALNGFGLGKLAHAKTSPYVAIMQGGNVISQKLGKPSKETVGVFGSIVNGKIVVKPRKAQSNSSFNNPVAITGVTAGSKKKSSINIEAVELSESQNGINIAIYNTITNELVDTSCFDPEQGFARVSD